ncbi:MAG: hypothetical protein U9N38_03280, partial [Thermodesulfobacteriota bacterium]|nr:hypothetical protein [Thermodesulfobacteriota bacterium]
MTIKKPILTVKQKIENEKIKTARRFASEFFSWKTAITLSMSLILAILLYPQILHIAPLEYTVGSIVAGNIKADRDFLVVDKAATEDKRAEAIENTRPVYDYDRNMPARIAAAISKAFLDMTENVKKQSGSPDSAKESVEKAKKRFEDISGITLTNREFGTLNKKGFPIDVCDNLIKLVYSTYKDRLVGNWNILSLYKNKGIIIRDIENQEEKELDNLSLILDTREMQSTLSNNATAIFKPKRPDKIVISLARKALRPNLTFAKNTTEKRKQMVSDEVKPVLYKLQKNEMIIREGEKITSEDLDKLDAFYKGQEGNKFIDVSIFSGIFLTILLLSVIFYRMASLRFRLGKTVLTDILYM